MWVNTWPLDKWKIDLQIFYSGASICSSTAWATAVHHSWCLLFSQHPVRGKQQQFVQTHGLNGHQGFLQGIRVVDSWHSQYNFISKLYLLSWVFDGREVGWNARNASGGGAAFRTSLCYRVRHDTGWHIFTYSLPCLISKTILYYEDQNKSAKLGINYWIPPQSPSSWSSITYILFSKDSITHVGKNIAKTAISIFSWIPKIGLVSQWEAVFLISESATKTLDPLFEEKVNDFNP